MKKNLFSILSLIGLLMYFSGFIAKIIESSYTSVFVKVSLVGIVIFVISTAIFIIQLLMKCAKKA